MSVSQDNDYVEDRINGVSNVGKRMFADLILIAIILGSLMLVCLEPQRGRRTDGISLRASSTTTQKPSVLDQANISQNAATSTLKQSGNHQRG